MNLLKQFIFACVLVVVTVIVGSIVLLGAIELFGYGYQALVWLAHSHAF